VVGETTLYETWTAHPNVTANGVDEETITIANRGNLPVWPLFLVRGREGVDSGRHDFRMVELPTLSAADGYVLVDTDPGNRTLTGSKDPVDNIFYDYIRSSHVRLLPPRHRSTRVAGVAPQVCGVQLADPGENVGEHQSSARQPNGTITAFCRKGSRGRHDLPASSISATSPAPTTYIPRDDRGS
jgi:hypothetical protein